MRAVVRHAHDGPLFRVGTGGGVVDVTAHHSLLRADASPCKPADVKRGDELLHEPLPAMPHLPETGSGLSGDAQAARALFERRVARGRPPPWVLVSRSKLEVAEACALAAKVGGLRASVHARRDGRTTGASLGAAEELLGAANGSSGGSGGETSTPRAVRTARAPGKGGVADTSTPPAVQQRRTARVGYGGGVPGVLACDAAERREYLKRRASALRRGACALCLEKARVGAAVPGSSGARAA